MGNINLRNLRVAASKFVKEQFVLDVFDINSCMLRLVEMNLDVLSLLT